MTETRRRTYTAPFKAEVGLEAIRGVQTTNEVAQAYGVHPPPLLRQQENSKPYPTASVYRAGFGRGVEINNHFNTGTPVPFRLRFAPPKWYRKEELGQR
jgi:hypothetical protein